MLRRIRMAAVGGAFAAAAMFAMPSPAHAQVSVGISGPIVTVDFIQACATVNPLGIPRTCVTIPTTNIP